MLFRECSDCGELKPQSDFTTLKKRWTRNDGTEGYCETPLHYCKACKNRRQREKYHSDPSARWRQIAWSQNARKNAKHKLSAEAIISLMKSAAGCAYCGHPNDGTIGFAVDHITPLSRGGLHVIDNLCAACQPCNHAKHDMTAEEYLAWLQGVARRLVS